MAIDTTTPANGTDQADEQAPSSNGHERVYDVEPGGAVKNWRRPDPAPDRNSEGSIIVKDVPCRNGAGEMGDPCMVDDRRGRIVQFMFVPARKRRSSGWDAVVRFDEGEPKEVQVNPDQIDLLLDEITRAPKGPISEQTTSYGVPTEASFGDDDVKEAGDLRQMAEAHIQETEDFPKFRVLLPRGIAWFWAKKGGSTGGQPILYRVRFATKHERKELGWRFVVTFASDVVRDQLLEREDLEALTHEALCVVERDEHGNLRKLAPDFRGYARNVVRYGDRVPLVRAAAEVLSYEVENVRNLRLDLDGSEDGDGEEIETGV